MSVNLNNTELAQLERINQLIDENLNNQLFSSDFICKELAISRSQLFRLVKENSQLSITLYIRQRKMLHAQELLDNSDLKISEIAYKIGIDSPQSFSKYFTDTHGISPTEYRKNKDKPTKVEKPPIVEPPIPAKTFVERPEIAKPKSRVVLILGGLLMILIGTGIYWKVLNNKRTANSPENYKQLEEASIAILPFKNLGSSEKNYLVDGLMGQVHSALTSLEKLKVISKNSSLLLKESKKTIPQIANDLGVAYILGGSVTQAANKVIVNIELIKAKEDRTVWSKNFEGDTKDVLVFMNQVAERVAEELNQKLSSSDTKKMEQLPTENIAAYNEYLQGLELVKTRKKDKMEAGLQRFDDAIALDAKFADAYSAKASAYYIMMGFDYIHPKTGLKLAEKAALDAIRLDEKNGTAYAVLAGCYHIQYKWEQAMTTFQIALQHSPNDALINYWFGLMLRNLGAFDAAIKYGKKAANLDPLNVMTYTGYINTCSYAGKVELAQKELDEKQLIFNEHFMYYYSRGTFYLAKKDYKKALKEYMKVDSMNKTGVGGHAIAYCQAKLGDKQSVLKFIATQPNDEVGLSNKAYAYAGLGDKEQTFKCLNLLAEQDIFLNYFKIDSKFDFLHSDPRYQNLLKKFGLLNVKINTD